jgi:sugar-specific transcriptional regulator TrmB
VASLKDDLTVLGSTSDLEYVWNIEGHDNVMAKALEMIEQAECRIYLSLLPETFPALAPALRAAVKRRVQAVVYSTRELDLPGARVVATSVPEEAYERVEGLWLVLVVDGREVLIGELLTQNRARASWTGSPLFVFVAEHHLRTDLYLPRVLALLGDQALELIQEQDHELFAYAFESRLEC